ncbi:MAG: ribonucleoside-diphosphate reductase alpha chain [Gammaproteobacteria bacterium]|jgi:ribonucleoside-diphosphate reductase alpha chain
MENIESPLTEPAALTATAKAAISDPSSTTTNILTNYNVIRRNGKLTSFDRNKIEVAMTKAFLAVEGGQAAASTRVHETVRKLTALVVDVLTRRQPDGGTFQIEDIQDQVELSLMRNGEQKVARSYVLYREQHSLARAAEVASGELPDDAVVGPALNVKMADGSLKPLDKNRIRKVIEDACSGLAHADPNRVYQDALKSLFDGVPFKDVSPTIVMSARGLIDREPEYSNVAARLLLDELRAETLTFINDGAPNATYTEMAERYPEYLAHYIKRASDLELLDKELLKFDLDKLGKALKPERDHLFTYLGMQTLYDRYFIHHEDTRFELPQAFFMRVSMGLAINEVNREERAIEFYNLLSSFDFMSSTPTLFNSGTLRPQLSSCYLTTIPDDLDGIFSAIKDDAMLSKFAGGLGNDWTRVRAMGSHIKGTNGKSQGVVPFLKVANDTAVAVNQGGKRKGAMCAYLETWHLDIEDFLELRKNTGEERRRTHDMNTANWIPDLFMKRVAEEAPWSLFSPDETPDLHDLYGAEFETAYVGYEAKAARGEIKAYRQIAAVDLWRKMLGMLFETGHPWVTFKDPCNIRSPQQHSGVVHSSNLCTEITLNTTDNEIAVCNLGSINLPQHMGENGLNLEKLEKSINTAMRMLDNVIDYNYYSVPQARKSNLRHRPVGLGIMGFQDALYKQHMSYCSEEAIDFADQSMEAVSYYTIQASTHLAEERGSYSTFPGSLWSQGILPIDSVAMLKDVRGEYLQQDQSSRMNWDSLRQRVVSVGMRNSNTMAIAPTATISNICGVSQSIEPIYQNLYVKSNLSGEFTVVNTYLVDDLKERDLWDEVMVNDLKYYDGSVQNIDRVPDDLKAIYSTAFEIDSRWLVEAGSRRQKWIDQGQSLNLYMAEPSGKKLDNLYKLAWVRGLKTTYYLRSLGATAVENTATRTPESTTQPEPEPQVCSILDPDCDACQ